MGTANSSILKELQHILFRIRETSIIESLIELCYTKTLELLSEKFHIIFPKSENMFLVMLVIQEEKKVFPTKNRKDLR